MYSLEVFLDSELIKYFHQWQKNLHKEQKAINTIEAYHLDLTCFIEFFYRKFKHKISIIDLENITVRELRAWLGHLSKTQNAVSRARAISSIKNFWLFLQNQDLLQNIAISLLRFPKKSKYFPKFIPEKTIQEIIYYLENKAKKKWLGKRDAAIVSLLYGSGLRISEAINLSKNDLNFQQYQLKILGKGQQERIVPLLPISINFLQEYMNYCPFTTGDILFFGVQGKKLQSRYFAKIIHNINIHFEYYFSNHTFRHSCATHLLAKGMDLRQIQQLLGHNSLRSTQIYADVDKKDILDCYKKNF